MYYTYVIKSLKNNRHYVGFTKKNPKIRLKEHNSATNIYTKHNRPFELIYFEQYETESFARKRERFLKSGHGREFLKRKLINLGPIAQSVRAGDS